MECYTERFTEHTKKTDLHFLYIEQYKERFTEQIEKTRSPIVEYRTLYRTFYGTYVNIYDLVFDGQFRIWNAIHSRQVVAE